MSRFNLNPHFKGSYIRHQVRAEPVLAMSMLAPFSIHLQQFIDQIEDLKVRTGVQRAAEFLLNLAAERNGECLLQLPFSQALIAATLGMDPATLSRAFSRLREHGARVEAGLVHIDDLKRLQDFMTGDGGRL